MRGRAEIVGALAVSVLGACTPTRDGPSDDGVGTGARVDTVVSTESALLARPVSLGLDGAGTVYVLDAIEGHVLRRTADGAALPPIGRLGSGPGEMKTPVSLAVDGDTLRIADPGNGRVVHFTLDGTPIGTSPIGTWSGGFGTQFGPGGLMLVPTLGLDSTLAVMLSSDGTELARLGSPVAPVSKVVSPSRMKQEIADGGVPDIFRNTVLLRGAADGGGYMVFGSEGIIRRYAPDGSLQWTHDLPIDELAAVRAEFVRSNAVEKKTTRVHPLDYVADLVESGDEVWVLVNQPPDRDGSIHVLSSDHGALRRVIGLPVRGARLLMPDRPRDVVWLVTLDDAQLLRVHLEQGGAS